MTAQNDIKLSVALVTRNRPDFLERCLKSLRAQSVQPFEVLVSDDSSDESERAANRDIALKWKANYVEGPQAGLYANRNLGFSLCTGTHIRTMDDDQTFPPGHLKLCLDAVQADPRALWTTGETTFDLSGELFGEVETAQQLGPTGMGHPVENLDDNWAIADGSTIYPAEIFAKGHRMADWFGYGNSYLEFGAYLYKLGYRSRCVKGAKVEHHTDVSICAERMAEQGWIDSRLYALISYNVYFRPDIFQAMKYSLACFRDSGNNPAFVRSWLLQADRANSRWSRIK